MRVTKRQKKVITVINQDHANKLKRLNALHGHDHIMTLSTKTLNSRVYQGNVFEMKD